jgi:hypothetical protein
VTGWKDKFPQMVEFEKRCEERKEFSETGPVMFDLKEAVV